MKKIIRLTEGDLHRIIKESVKRMLKEYRVGRNELQSSLDDEPSEDDIANTHNEYSNQSGPSFDPSVYEKIARDWEIDNQENNHNGHSWYNADILYKADGMIPGIVKDFIFQNMSESRYQDVLHEAYFDAQNDYYKDSSGSSKAEILMGWIYQVFMYYCHIPKEKLPKELRNILGDYISY